MSCYGCIFKSTYQDMGASCDVCKLQDNLADAVKACDNSGNCPHRVTLEEAKTKLLSSDVAPVRHGKWVKGDFKFAEMSCSLCGFTYYGEHDVECMSNFCPECGAKMDFESSEKEIN